MENASDTSNPNVFVAIDFVHMSCSWPAWNQATNLIQCSMQNHIIALFIYTMRRLVNDGAATQFFCLKLRMYG